MQSFIYLTLVFISTNYAYGDSETKFPGSFNGEISIESRYYINEAEYNNDTREDISLSIKPEYSYSWDEDRSVFTVVALLRHNSIDEQKSLVDLREFSYVSSFKNIELRAGISKVFWGVTESLHLVDVINQTDFVASIDGEEKLGQLMFNPTLVTDFGNFSYFLLPNFRERTFPGDDGRLRGSLAIDTSESKYGSSEKTSHIDHAIRWSHYYGPIEWALSYFEGTDREPQFSLNSRNDRLVPNYKQTRQTSLELQYNYEDWIYKAEYLQKKTEQTDFYQTAVTGLEYTFSNVYGGKDIGLIYEYIYDERFEEATHGIFNSSFIGSRLSFNDADSSDLLIGGILSHLDFSLTSFRLEGSSRLARNFKAELEFNIIDTPQKESALYQLKEDDYLQVNLSYYY